MWRLGLSLMLVSGACWAQGADCFRPAATNVWGVDKVPVLYLGVGIEEPRRMHDGLLRLHASLNEAAFKHVFYEFPGAAHEWQTRRRNLQDFAPRLS